jgi:hypothetical protein
VRAGLVRSERQKLSNPLTSKITLVEIVIFRVSLSPRYQRTSCLPVVINESNIGSPRLIMSYRRVNPSNNLLAANDSAENDPQPQRRNTNPFQLHANDQRSQQQPPRNGVFLTGTLARHPLPLKQSFDKARVAAEASWKKVSASPKMHINWLISHTPLTPLLPSTTTTSLTPINNY